MRERCYRCPDCGGSFWVPLVSANQPPPDDCPICHGAGAPPAEPVDISDLRFPHIAKSIGKVTDKVYRDMESGSQARAEMAAEVLGESAAETGMEMTNLKDSLREGDTAAALPVSPEMTSFVQNNPNVMNMKSPEVGAEFAAATRQGPAAGAGDWVRSQVQRQHHVTAASVMRAGNMGVAK